MSRRSRSFAARRTTRVVSIRSPKKCDISPNGDPASMGETQETGCFARVTGAHDAVTSGPSPDSLTGQRPADAWRTPRGGHFVEGRSWHPDCFYCMRRGARTNGLLRFVYGCNRADPTRGRPCCRRRHGARRHDSGAQQRLRVPRSGCPRATAAMGCARRDVFAP